MINTYELSEASRKLIGQWSRDDYYVYIRPTSSKWAEPNERQGQWWVVSIQIRALPPHEYREEGRSLDVCIRKLGRRIPRRKDLVGPEPTGRDIGFLAPHARWEAKYREIEGMDPLARRSVKEEHKAKKAALIGSHVGPIHDRLGEGRPKASTEKGHGTDKIRKKKGKKKT